MAEITRRKMIMKKMIIAALLVATTASSAFAWEISNKWEYNDKISFELKCRNGKFRTVIYVFSPSRYLDQSGTPFSAFESAANSSCGE
jgi:hypothetical protein